MNSIEIPSPFKETFILKITLLTVTKPSFFWGGVKGSQTDFQLLRCWPADTTTHQN